MIDLSLENKAKEILEKHGLDQSVPVDPIKIANENGIEVKNAIFKSEKICGILHEKDGKTTIYVNKHDSNNRKRFSIAHELGHYFLHHFDGDDTLVVELRTNDGNNRDPQKEKEANCFAAALLMNEVLVKSVWNDLKSVRAVAEIFQVSYESMSYRLNNLGLLVS